MNFDSFRNFAHLVFHRITSRESSGGVSLRRAFPFSLTAAEWVTLLNVWLQPIFEALYDDNLLLVDSMELALKREMIEIDVGEENVCRLEGSYIAKFLSSTCFARSTFLHASARTGNIFNKRFTKLLSNLKLIKLKDLQVLCESVVLQIQEILIKLNK